MSCFRYCRGLLCVRECPHPHQRIYGTAWETSDQLSQYQEFLEEAKARDHRVIGKKLDLFSLQEGAGGGLVFWHDKGAMMRESLKTIEKINILQ